MTKAARVNSLDERTDMPIEPGSMLPCNVRLIERISSGELFVSFIAEYEALKRRVYCKVQRDDLDGTLARAAFDHLSLWGDLAKLCPAGMPTVLHFGEWNGLAYLATEWIEGTSLHDLGLIPGRFIAAPRTFPDFLLWRCLQTLTALHTGGLWHGDLSPNNILVSDTLAKVWLIDPAPAARAGNRVITTREWAAPEVLLGRGSGPWSDLYSLGLVISTFCLRCGFPVPSHIELLTQQEVEARPRDATKALEAFQEVWKQTLFLTVPTASSAASTAGKLRPQTLQHGAARGEFTQLLKAARGAPNASLPIIRPAPPPPRIVQASAAPPAARPHPSKWLARLFKGSKSPSSANKSSLSTAAKGLVSKAYDLDTGTTGDEPIRWSGLTMATEAPVERTAEILKKEEPLHAAEQAGWSNRTAIFNVPIRTSPTVEPQEADFIVMGPTVVARENTFPLELWVGPSAQATELRERAGDRGRLVERGARSKIELQGSVMITAIMTLPGFDVINSTEQIHWDGSIRNTVFLVSVAPHNPPGRYSGLIKLVVGTVPLGMVSFSIEIAEGRDTVKPIAEQLSTPLQRHRTAFASYSRMNTAEVFKRVQAIRAGDIDIFVDIANLRGGDRWQNVLMHEIAVRDTFFLFWSREAAKSSWVEREWKEALNRRGLDFICPIPLEDPRFAAPPKELQDLHFNDWCLAVIRGEEALSADPEGEDSSSSKPERVKMGGSKQEGYGNY